MPGSFNRDFLMDSVFSRCGVKISSTVARKTFWQQDDFQPCSPALTSQRRRDPPAATSTSQPRRAPAPPDPETSCAAAQPEVKLTL